MPFPGNYWLKDLWVLDVTLKIEVDNTEKVD